MLKELLKTSEYNLHCPAMWKDTQYVFMDVSWRCGNHSWFTFVPWCRYCSVSFQSLLFSHLAIALIHNTKKLPVFHSPLKPHYPPVFKFSKLISTHFLLELNKRSRHFLLGDHFVNSHNLISWLCKNYGHC